MKLITERNFIKEKLEGIHFEMDYSLKNFSRYKTGGNGRIVVFPKRCEDVIKVTERLKEEYPIFVIGGGSNLLISDKGYNGVVISTIHLNDISLNSPLLTAECGATMCAIISETSINCLSGLEFMVGIPATVGGAVAMNAGCHNRNVSENICYVVTNKGTYRKEECLFEYRKSRFLNNEVILKVCFSLNPAEEDIIEDKIKTYKGFRRTPKGRNCGSVFKNDGYFAGKIIDEVGLKGYKHKGAKVSETHANYIIAEENCTSLDIYELIHKIKDKVKSLKQIDLNEEIIYLGEF